MKSYNWQILTVRGLRGITIKKIFKHMIKLILTLNLLRNNFCDKSKKILKRKDKSIYFNLNLLTSA